MTTNPAPADPTLPSGTLRGATATTVSVNQLDLEVAIVAKVLAEISDRRPRTTWESEAARDATLGPPTIADALLWLPTCTELLFGRQNAGGGCQVVAAVGQSYVQLTAFGDHVDVVVADDDPDHAQEVGRSILDNVPALGHPLAATSPS